MLHLDPSPSTGILLLGGGRRGGMLGLVIQSLRHRCGFLFGGWLHRDPLPNAEIQLLLRSYHRLVMQKHLPWHEDTPASGVGVD